MTHSTLCSMWTEVDGRRIHARAAVDYAPPGAPAIVLVHGLVVSSRYMIPLMRHLAPHYRVYAPDLPGFGQSDAPDHVLNVAELADALVAWMDSVGIEQAVLVGNSSGCQFIAECVLRYAERLRAAVLQGPTFDPDARTLYRQIWRWLVDGTREPPSHAINMVLDYWDAGVRRFVGTLRYVLQDRIETKLPRMYLPTLVVRGSRDPIVPQRWAEEATRLLPCGRLVIIPGATHTINYAAPLELARVVRCFVEKIEAQRTGGKEIERTSMDEDATQYM